MKGRGGGGGLVGWGVSQIDSPLQKRLPSKSPALLGLILVTLKDRRKEKVGERSFALYQHSCLISKFQNFKISQFQNFILEKYEYDNNQKLQPVGLQKKRCAVGIIFLGISNCSSMFETPQNLHVFRFL